MIKRIVIPILSVALIILALGCGKKKYLTPADVKGTVAWLDARSALPVFPMGTNTIYMFVNADWCKYCQAMKKDIFSRPEIIEYMNKHFTSISVLPDSLNKVIFLGQEMNGAQFREALKVEGYPSHYFFNMKGEVIGVRAGYLDLLEFKRLLKYFAEGSAEKMDYDTFLSTEDAAIDTVWGEF